MQETFGQSLGGEDALKEGLATHSSILTWRIPWTEEPGRLHRVHGVAEGRTRLSDFTFTFHFYALEKEIQSFCLENPRDGGAWWAAVCGITQSRTRLN